MNATQMRPAPILSNADLDCAFTDCHGCRVCAGLVHGQILPPADDRAQLVRADLLDTVQRYTGLKCFARAVTAASTRAEWSEVCDDFERMRGRTGDSNARHNLTAAAEAAEAMGDGDVDAALQKLARSCGLTVDAWVVWTRREIAAKGGAL